jgi:hypothetical protein
VPHQQPYDDPYAQQDDPYAQQYAEPGPADPYGYGDGGHDPAVQDGGTPYGNRSDQQ